MPTPISWDETAPADAQSASTADNEIRSMLSNTAGGLGTSFFWPGSAQSQGASDSSGGELRPGSLRFARAGPSARTGGHPDGFLLLDSNRVSIHHIGSTMTMILGHSDMQERSGEPSNAPYTARWVMQEGQLDLASNETQTVESLSTNFPTPYDGVPEVYLSGASFGINWLHAVSSITTAGFTAQFSYVGGVAGIASPVFLWRSEGTISY